MAVTKLARRFHEFRQARRRSDVLKCSSYVQRRAFSGCGDRNSGDESVLPVLIVGAGPVGLVLSILLTKLGVKSAIIEKNKAFSLHPQAHFVNNRSMEIFRKLNGLADEILRHEAPVDWWRKFIYCTSLTGPILGSVDHMQPQDFDRIVSSVSVAHFSQYKLMRLLIKQLEETGFHIRDELMNFDYCKPAEREILMGCECTSIKVADDVITVTGRLTRKGNHRTKEFPCNFVVGTDGAGSTVRKLMGIGMRGEQNMQHLISVHFMSVDLGQYLIKERPGMLYFIFNTEAIGVIVAHDLQQGEFVLQLPFYPPQQKFEEFSFKSNTLWGCCSSLPPAGGFGMNTGIQDVHNLAWKLASVIKGTAPPSILSTYETEHCHL